MREVISLLKPRLWTCRNGFATTNLREKRLRFLFFGAIGLTVWVGIFAVFYRVLTYFQGTEAFGDILAFKLLSMTLVTFFSLLIVSSILTALSKLYLSRDLTLVHAMPVRAENIFLARWFESAMDSSWMVLVYSLPVFLSYGIVYQAGPLFYGTVIFNLFPFCLMASALSTLVILVAAAVVPAGRIRGIFVLLAGILFLILVIGFRLMQPERLVNPAAFSTAMLYVKALETPDSPLLPTTWMMDSLKAALSGSVPGALFHGALGWSFALTAVFTTTGISGALYLRGLNKAQSVSGRLFSLRMNDRWQERVFQAFPSPVRAIAIKEIRTFFRDQTQWPQLFLILALVAIYLYNFYVLPVDRSVIKTEYIQNILAFLNMGLSTFVLAALSARFVFPAVSNEGPAFWIILSSPVSLKTFIRIKFCLFLVPLIVLTETLIVASNILLQVTPFMMVLSVITVFFMVPAVVAMGIGLGAAYPDFKSENPLQSATSFGGLIYMTVCAAMICGVIVLEAGPAYTIFMAGVRGKDLTTFQWIWISLSFLAALVLCLAATVISMKWGERKISDATI